MQHSIDTELDQYIDRLSLAQKRSILNMIKSFIETDTPVSLKQYNHEIDEAMLRMDSGKFISQEYLEKEL